MDFYNIAIARPSFNLDRENAPKSFSFGGLSENGIWYINLNEKLKFRWVHEFAGVYSMPVGKVFPLRDICSVILAVYLTEDPKDGVGLIHFLSSYIPIGKLKKSSILSKTLERDIAEEIKLLCKKTLFVNNDDKHIHLFLRQTNSKDF